MVVNAIICIVIGVASSGVSNYKDGEFDAKGFLIGSAFAGGGGVVVGKFAGSFTDSAFAKAADMEGGQLASTVTAQNIGVINLINVSGLAGGLVTKNLLGEDG